MQAHCFDVAEVQLLSAGLSLEQELVPLEQPEQAQLEAQVQIDHEIDAVGIVEQPAKTKLSACLMLRFRVSFTHGHIESLSAMKGRVTARR